MTGLSAAIVPLDDGAPMVELMVHFEPRDGSLVGVATYRADVFAPATVERMLGHFVSLLEGAVADPDRTVGSLPLLSATERRRVLTMGRGTALHIDSEATLWSLFESWSARAPRALALECNGETRTYCEVRTDARAIACALRDQGLGPGSRVGVVMEPSPRLLSTMLGVLASGSAVVPIGASVAQARRRHIVVDAEVSLVLDDGPLDAPALASDLPAPMLYVPALLDTPVTVAMAGPIHSPAQGDLAFVIYSGEDVRPGGVAIEHRSVINWLLGLPEQLRISPGVRVAESSAARLEAPWLSLLPVLSGGVSVMVDDGPGAPDTTASLGSAGVEVARMDPVSLRRLLQATDDQLHEWRSLRSVACDGRDLTPDLVALFYSRMSVSGLDARLYAVYGWPESTGHGATMAYPALEGTPSTTLAGRAAPNARLYVVDDWGGLCPIGIPGEVWIGGAPLARGYLDRANLTAERFFPDPFARGGRVFRTGERARWRTDGGLEQLGPLRL